MSSGDATKTDRAGRGRKNGPERATQLREPIALGPGDSEVRDLETFCRTILVESIRREKPQPPLTQAEFDDSLRHLIGEAWVIYNGDPNRLDRSGVRKPLAAFDHTKGVPFAAYAAFKLRYALIDYWRSIWRRHGLGRVAYYDQTDDDTGDEDADVDGAAGGPRRLRGALTDPADDWVAAVGGLHAAGDREASREDGGLGVGAGVGDSEGDHQAGVGAVRRVDRAGQDAARQAPWLDCVKCGWRNFRQPPNGRPGWHFDACAACGMVLEEQAA